jgi:hypothetical protein
LRDAKISTTSPFFKGFRNFFKEIWGCSGIFG